VFFCLTALLCLWAGLSRKEPVLILLGVIPLAALGYCFAGVCVLALIHWKGALGLQARALPRSTEAGMRIAVALFPREEPPPRGGVWAFRFPGILIRYEFTLRTRDGRVLRRVLEPRRLREDQGLLHVPERGAYYGGRDRLYFFDAFGFFRLAFSLPQEPGPRLLAAPWAAEKPPSLALHAGGSLRSLEQRYLRSDTLTDHRPYVPGDDPRRINWKLYGHLGDMVIREGEFEPPPLGRLLILVDTQFDPLLYTLDAARQGVDMLCENALALALECSGQGREVRLGYTGMEAGRGLEGAAGQEPPGLAGGRTEGPLTRAGAFAELLAYPAALPLDSPDGLPPAAEGWGVLITALPRAPQSGAGLERFLQNREPPRRVDILFIISSDAPGELESYAETCVRFYNAAEGVHARYMRR
jgi:uncharacterized protein (DUF58 family)